MKVELKNHKMRKISLQNKKGKLSLQFNKMIKIKIMKQENNQVH